MTWLKPSWQAVLAILLCLVAFALGAMSIPEAAALAEPTATVAYQYVGAKALIIGLLLIAALVSMVTLTPIVEAVVLFVGAHAAAWLLIRGIAGFEG
ncbi:ABC transporter permease, partial [Mesorhizobium sp. M2D.F.Ca.ET.223.01.1.1]